MAPRACRPRFDRTGLLQLASSRWPFPATRLLVGDRPRGRLAVQSLWRLLERAGSLSAQRCCQLDESGSDVAALRRRCGDQGSFRAGRGDLELAQRRRSSTPYAAARSVMDPEVYPLTRRMGFRRTALAAIARGQPTRVRLLSRLRPFSRRNPVGTRTRWSHGAVFVYEVGRPRSAQ